MPEKSETKAYPSLLFALLLIGSNGAIGEDIYRCPSPNGTIYQATPCKGGAYKGSMNAGQAVPSASDSANLPVNAQPKNSSSPSDLERSKAFLASREQQRRKEELQGQIARNDSAIQQAQSAMDSELSILKAKKALASNNLAGATWEQSLSSEMQAVVSKYKAIMDSKQEDNRRLRDELSKQ